MNRSYGYDMFEVPTNKKVEVVDITDEVQKACGEGEGEGNICNVYVPHATAAIVINEFEPNIKADMEEFFEKIAAREGTWRHDQIDDNASAHLTSALFGPSVTIPIENGKLQLGTWQRILLVELDGPRTRQIIVKTI